MIRSGNCLEPLPIIVAAIYTDSALLRLKSIGFPVSLLHFHANAAVPWSLAETRSVLISLSKEDTGLEDSHVLHRWLSY